MSRIRRVPLDASAILLLIVLWAFFFWRLFTPIAADRASLKLGDFSGQFVAFAGYQYERFSRGEVPLWNPYNNGGLPFIADTQAAVFYPPRLITIAAASLTGGWTYHALELEMTAHVLAYSLLMYLLIRRWTLGQRGSVVGSLIGSLVSSYSGFMSGYPPLQLAILEAATWTPLALLGILETTRAGAFRWRWLLVTGGALGLSWLAGHPQTSYFITLLLIAFLAWRCYRQPAGIIRWVIGCAMFGGIAFGLAAVQLLPGLEYLTLTARFDLGFDAKGNGFPFHDVAQMLYPGTVSLFSPLYVGFFGLSLAALAVWRRLPDSRFLAGMAAVSLVWSFGANSALYDLFYNLLPGLRFFRGQERAAFLVMTSLSILAGLGAVHVMGWRFRRDYFGAYQLHRALRWLLVASTVIFGAAFIFWLYDREALASALPGVAFGTFMIAAAAVVIPLVMLRSDRRYAPLLLIAAVTFELFNVNMNSAAVYDPVPPEHQLSMNAPPLVQAILDRAGDAPFRVDGFRGLHDNYGSLYRIQDMRGISPLFLTSAYQIIEGETAIERAWEIFAVRYVYTDWQELPVPSEIIAEGFDRWGHVNLHELRDPRPYAQIMYDVWFAADDAEARAVLNRDDVNLRRTLILSRQVAFTPSPERVPVPAPVTIFEPEFVSIDAVSEGEGMLSIAMVHYPGWQAWIDGEPADILTAYGALIALIVPDGTHTVTLRFDPPLYRVGAALSLVTLAGMCILAGGSFIRRQRTHALYR
ncbi:YfhO family protein [Kamptonema cortianum]|nr:YfhO family protein [Kamptonema cortianum]